MTRLLLFLSVGLSLTYGSSFTDAAAGNATSEPPSASIMGLQSTQVPPHNYGWTWREGSVCVMEHSDGEAPINPDVLHPAQHVSIRVWHKKKPAHVSVVQQMDIRGVPIGEPGRDRPLPYTLTPYFSDGRLTAWDVVTNPAPRAGIYKLELTASWEFRLCRSSRYAAWSFTVIGT